ncbi:zinc finger CCCH domain-containing protein 15 homolog [Chironomus tepperi]|uniref:zinc finger CCCH domain-containing protein 15 homolog n=1 Tax=Chironomus tepperi TaxID=113505 RepID=UPI00391F528E
MPPKKAQAAPSKKTEQKKKEKIIEDKTFGLKNKKGAKTQKFIAQVEKQVKQGGQPAKARDLPEDKRAEKERKLKEQKELAALFKPVIPTQKIEAGTDPKSVLCAYFKNGQCTKGDKCKFSHDLAIERKGEKRSIYCDVRQTEDTMENWDETKLKDVIEKKHAAEKTNATTIICKFFIEAVEKSLYGWFWACPNGEKCIYRHALPPGYVLKKDKKKDDKKDEISLEELIETERANLGTATTKVTLETFLAWKKRKIEEKRQAELEEEKKKLKDYKAGKQFGISGREMFSFNPDLVNDAMDEGDEAFEMIREQDEDETNFKEIDFSALSAGLKEVDASGLTIATEDRLEKLKESVPVTETAADEAGPINENLFLDEDLEGLDDELNDLDVNDDDEEDTTENTDN